LEPEQAESDEKLTISPPLGQFSPNQARESVDESSQAQKIDRESEFDIYQSTRSQAYQE